MPPSFAWVFHSMPHKLYTAFIFSDTRTDMHTVLLVVSLSLFVLALVIQFRGKTNTFFGRMLGFLFSFTTLGLLLFWYVSDQFTGVGINDAVIYHVRYGLDGAGFFQYHDLIYLTSIIAIIGIALILFIFLRKKQSDSSSIYLPPLLLLGGSLILNPAIYDIVQMQMPQVAADSFDNYYRTPTIHRVDDKPKNLVFIYAESLERGYFDETVYPGLITNLRDYENQAVSFTNLVQLPYLTYTIAGMTGSQFGIPFVSLSGVNSMAGMDRFLASATGLGDLLNADGYQLAYRGGANLDFGGKGSLFRSHGFDDVQGYDELYPRVDDYEYRTDWGLYDDSLLDIVYEDFLLMSEADQQPFGLFTLTLDTHGEGHASRSCDDIVYHDGKTEILNAVACSDHLISALVDKIIASPYSDQTLIVIASDHLSNIHSNPKIKNTSRRNLFLVLDPDNDTPLLVDTLGSTLDIGPTILPFLGFSGDIGLGRDLMDRSEAARTEREFIQKNLGGWAEDIKQFWDFPKIENNLTISTTTNTFAIDDRSFRLPVLILPDEELNTSLAFGLYQKKLLSDYFPDLSNDQRYLLIDICNNIEPLADLQFVQKNSYCLMAGVGQQPTFLGQIHRDITISAENIHQLLKPTAQQVASSTDGLTNLISNTQEDAIVTFGDELTLIDYTITVNDADHASATVALTWQVDQKPQADHTLFLHIIDKDGLRLAQIDQPMGDLHPTSSWQVGEKWINAYTIDLPSNLGIGSYKINLGIYDWPSLDHLMPSKGEHNYFDLGNFFIHEVSPLQEKSTSQ